jgi:hypothetical protein
MEGTFLTEKYTFFWIYDISTKVDLVWQAVTSAIRGMCEQNSCIAVQSLTDICILHLELD